MSYQVLARKWRPKHFKELVGQEHVVTVLVNALAQQRLHHAYLFTGTRGVGKTTIARIFAKSLNCEQGISTEPCGQCDTCIDIDQGKFIDLLEIDAASRTKVDDTREILDNVQYAPSRGRYKVYLIDEVHMLSRSSFNALLKTLEEPPEHVKFILATTDPQKLPVTVLSRCLQFHLKALTQQQIEQKLTEILNAEDVTCQEGTLSLLSKAARGSMRDSLSITDQAIAQGQGTITLANLQQMLGGVDQNWPFKLLVALAKSDSQALMSLSLEIASYAPNYSRLLADLIQLLHQIALSQIVEQHFDLSSEHKIILTKLCQALSPEDVQLYYQIAVNGRKDLPYAGDEQAAFDMVLLRLLAFKPVVYDGELAKHNDSTGKGSAQAINFDDCQLPTTEISSVQAPDSESAKEMESDGDAHLKLPEQAEELTVLTPRDNLEKQLVEIADEASISDDETASLSAEMQAIEQNAAEQGFLQVPENNDFEQENGHKQSTRFEESTDLEQTGSERDATKIALFDDVKDSSCEQPTAESTVASEQQAIDTQNQPTTQPLLEEQSSASPIEHEQVSQENQHEQAVSMQQEQAQVVAAQFNSPVGDILATRNMLRSRKKQLENAEKKSSDVSGRQLAATQSAISEQESSSSDETNGEPKVAPVSIAELNADSYNPEVIDPATIRSATQVDKWAQMIDAMELTARLRQLAIHATIDESSTDDCLKLKLDQATKHLKSEAAHKQLEQRISEYLSRNITVEVEVVEQTIADPYQIQSDINDKRQDYAIELIKADPVVNHLISSFDAVLDEESIVAL